MFNKHLLKVILGFCGMILLGLISLVIINSMSSTQTATQTTTTQETPKPQAKASISGTLPPVKK